MSTKKNKEVILSFYDLYNQKKLDACYELLDPELILHGTTGNMTHDQLKQFDISVLGAFDGICNLSNLVAEGDKVAFQVNAKHIHKGEFMGVAPTGKSYQMTNTYIVKIKNNKVVEWWGTTEIPLIMQQIGVVPKQ
jgi:predicted ester cyclase